MKKNEDTIVEENITVNRKYIKLIILVIADTKSSYNIKFIENYWKPFIKYLKDYTNIKVFLLFGEKPSININKDDVIISYTEENLIPGILKKTIFAFEYLHKNYDFKHVLRTNICSFFVLDRLLEINNNLGSEKVYWGCGSKRFHCGAGIWLSKDIINFLLRNKNNIRWDIIDDVSIWSSLKHLPKNKLPKYDILADFRYRFSYLINKINKNNYYHLRIKSENRHNDAELIDMLTKYYYKQ